MNQKFVILLFGTFFYYGVAYSSPIKQEALEAVVAEEKPPTDPRPTTEHINEKIEVATGNNTLPVQKTNTSSIVMPSPKTDANVTISRFFPTFTPPIIIRKSKNETVNVKNETLPMSNTTEQAIGNNSTKQEERTFAATNRTTDTNATTAINETAVTPVVPSTAVNPENKITTGTAKPTVSPLPSTPEHSKTNTTTPEHSGTNTTTTPVTSTLAPVSTSNDNVLENNTPSPVPSEKHFDGQSFVGGMALTIGLTAIGFIAFKYYKSGKIDMNYRTL